MLIQVKNFFSKPYQGVSQIQQKNVSPFMSFVNYLAFNGWANLSAYQSMTYYMQVSPLYDAVDTIVTECANIRLYIFNSRKDVFEKHHQVLDLLQNPNTDMGRIEFFSQVIAYYLITGNTYWMTTGDPTKPPLEMFPVSPEYITLIPDERDGYTKTIFYNSNVHTLTFERKYIDGRFRFIDKEGKRTIYHVRKFNPLKGINNNYGLSPLTAIFYEIEQYIKSGIHNLSLLARGARPTGAFTTPESLSDESYSRLQEQMERFLSGAENAGRPLLLEQDLKFQEMAVKNKDMDFEKLKEGLITQIHNSYKIPLALRSKESMSYNNLETARLMLYDFSVLPILNRILEELTSDLMYRYGDENIEIAYNKDSITALQVRRNEELKITKELGVNSINEIRGMKGEKPASGGDDIYGSAASYPIARVGSKVTEEEAHEENEEDANEKAQYLDYINMMKRVRTNEGLPAFSTEQIKKRAKEYGLSG